MPPEPGKQTTEIHIFSNILSKSNQTMKSDQLIKHNMRKFFRQVIHKI